ncbi:unnamed protein product [Blepharisma stoltei]|uniref:RING-type domain-containing protein n=1 Tax=Blepharisma stoltei TaxID=1481888 RepID=A0AAU9JT02_9CILI|nr:unnamed protein product [Blepharisma stoltei]
MNPAYNEEDLPDIKGSSPLPINIPKQPSQLGQQMCIKCSKSYDSTVFNIECPNHKLCISCRAQNPDRCLFFGCNRLYNEKDKQIIYAYIKKIDENYFTCDLCGVKKPKFMRKINDQCDCNVCLMCSIGDPYECAYCCQRSSEIIISDIKGIACSNCETLLDNPEKLRTHNCYVGH